VCSFELIDHTADVGFRVQAPDLDELFAEAARALFSTLLENPEATVPIEQVEFQLRADSLPLLLVDWLRELLYVFDTQHLALWEFHPRVNERRIALTAECRGEPLDWNKYRPGTEVKAITYHGLKLEKQNGLWIAEVIVDI
jgi:SHS2 domain-containing protein